MDEKAVTGVGAVDGREAGELRRGVVSGDI